MMLQGIAQDNEQLLAGLQTFRNSLWVSAPRLSVSRGQKL